VPTAPLTGARYPSDQDNPLGGTVIGWSVTDLEDNTIPRFATGGERDTAYANWAALPGNAIAAGMHCTVGGRLQRHNGTTWDFVPTHRGNGTTYPASPVEGDTYRHDTLRCTMRYRNAAWVQADLARVTNDGDRVSYLAALGTAGVLMHGGFMVRQDDTDMFWWADTNTTLAPVGSYRGSGDTFPAAARDGDTFYSTLYRCVMTRRGTAWWQTTITQVASDADRTAFTTALNQAGGATMHVGFQVMQTDTNVLYLCTGGRTLAPVYPPDTGGQALSLADPWTPVVSTYREEGKRVHFTIHATRASWAAGTGLRTWGANLRPSFDQYFLGIYQGRVVEIGLSAATGDMTVNTAGTGGVVVSGSYLK
jgi:hypothetical protein